MNINQIAYKGKASFSLSHCIERKFFEAYFRVESATLIFLIVCPKYVIQRILSIDNNSCSLDGHRS